MDMQQVLNKSDWGAQIVFSSILWVMGIIMMTRAFTMFIFVFADGKVAILNCLVSAVILTTILCIVFHNVPSEYVKQTEDGDWELSSYRQFSYPFLIMVFALVLT